jgi:hypothetical protein
MRLKGKTMRKQVLIPILASGFLVVAIYIITAMTSTPGPLPVNALMWMTRAIASLVQQTCNTKPPSGDICNGAIPPRLFDFHSVEGGSGLF